MWRRDVIGVSRWSWSETEGRVWPLTTPRFVWNVFDYELLRVEEEVLVVVKEVLMMEEVVLMVEEGVLVVVEEVLMVEEEVLMVEDRVPAIHQTQSNAHFQA
ncbi:unnamed protein product [Gadus morhua 'NCC']